MYINIKKIALLPTKNTHFHTNRSK